MPRRAAPRPAVLVPNPAPRYSSFVEANRAVLWAWIALLELDHSSEPAYHENGVADQKEAVKPERRKACPNRKASTT
jgi:hypothetical protein